MFVIIASAAALLVCIGQWSLTWPVKIGPCDGRPVEIPASQASLRRCP
jgi:hypothetical protein